MAPSVLSAPMASIGVPKEFKLDEQRVALTPDAVRELVSQGLEVRIETGAGSGAGIGDDAFAAAGAQLVSREEAWGAHLVVKVKEPQSEEFRYLRRDMVLFTYLHLAAYPTVGEALLEAGTAASGGGHARRQRTVASEASHDSAAASHWPCAGGQRGRHHPKRECVASGQNSPRFAVRPLLALFLALDCFAVLQVSCIDSVALPCLV